MIPAPTLEMVRPAYGPDSLSAALRWEHAGGEYGSQQIVTVVGSPTEGTMFTRSIEAIQKVIDEYIQWLEKRSTTEYRLVVDKGYQIKRYDKRDYEHAQKGLLDAFRDFERYKNSDGMDAWIETRTVTDWERTID